MRGRAAAAATAAAARAPASRASVRAASLRPAFPSYLTNIPATEVTTLSNGVRVASEVRVDLERLFMDAFSGGDCEGLIKPHAVTCCHAPRARQPALTTSTPHASNIVQGGHGQTATVGVFIDAGAFLLSQMAMALSASACGCIGGRSCHLSSRRPLQLPRRLALRDGGEQRRGTLPGAHYVQGVFRSCVIARVHVLSFLHVLPANLTYALRISRIRRERRACPSTSSRSSLRTWAGT